MKIRSLISFVTIVKNGSFISAARALSYAESTIYEHIKSLETYLGVNLFVKRSSPIVLTEDGKIAYEYCNKILEYHHKMLYLLAETKSQKRLIRIVTIESLLRSDVQTVLEIFNKDHPNTIIHMTLRDSPEILSMVNNNEADVGFMSFVSPNISEKLHFIKISDTPFVFLASQKSKLSRISKVTYNDLAGEQFITSLKGGYENAIIKACLPKRIKFRGYIEMDGLDIIKEYVINNVGITLLPETSVQDEIASGQLVNLGLPDPPVLIAGCCIYSTSAYKVPYIREFIDNIHIIYHNKNHS